VEFFLDFLTNSCYIFLYYLLYVTSYMKLIDGKAIAEKIEEGIKASGKTGGLAVILVGDNSASQIYVKKKEEAAKRTGIKFYGILYPITNYQLLITNYAELEEKIISKIKELNSREDITGIIVQLPLPKGLDTNKIIAAIDPKKDVDGYHPENIKKFQNGKFSFYPPVLGAIISILESEKISIENKTVALVSNSNFFPLPFIPYFKNKAKKFFDCSSADACYNLQAADIVITAVGQKHYLKSSMVKKDAIIIDVGIVREGKKIYGDADLESLKERCAAATPVPGGVGPITVARLLLNTIKI